MQSLTPPAPSARSFIVLVSLLQGLLLYWAQTGIENDWWPFSHLGGRVCWYTLALIVPSLMTLTVQRLDDLRFWQHAAGATVLVALLAWWAAWSATGDAEIRASSVLGPFGFTLAVGFFIALPYLQIRLDHGRWIAGYDELFERAWQNGLVILLTGFFTGLCWAVLWLCAALFELIDIDFFDQLFRKPAFAYLATGVMVGLGILVGRAQPQAVRVARQILLAIFKGLLPMLAIVALMFLVSLPFTGLEPLWKTRFAAGTLCCLLVLLVLLVNAVFQDGKGERPYPMLLRRVVEGALLAMPVFAAIALYAMWLRIAQYGWTQDRFWAALAGLILFGYSIGYAISVLRGRDSWLPLLPRVNVAISLLILALVVAANSPLLDPHRLTVSSQLARLDASKPDSFDARHLRFDSGRRGVVALQALLTDQRVVASADMHEKIELVLAERLSPWERNGPDAIAVRPTVDALRTRLRTPPGMTPPPDALVQRMIDLDDGSDSCNTGAECVVIDPDLDADGEREYVLCRLQHPAWIPCQLWRLEDGSWQMKGQLQTSGSPDSGVTQALREGRIELRPSRWSDLHIGDATYRVPD
jgi:hypothetical protein